MVLKHVQFTCWGPGDSLDPFDIKGLELLNSPTSRNLHFAPFPSLIIEVIHEVVVGIKNNKMYINRGMDKEDVIDKHTHTHTHTHNGILLSHKKGKNGVISRDVDGPRLLYRVKRVRKTKTKIIY